MRPPTERFEMFNRKQKQIRNSYAQLTRMQIDYAHVLNYPEGHPARSIVAYYEVEMAKEQATIARLTK